MISPSPAPVRSAPSFVEFREEIQSLYANDCGQKAFSRLRKVLRQVAGLGVTELAEITPLVLSRWRQTVSHLAPLSQKSDYGSLVTALDFAVRAGYLERSPAKVWPLRFSTKKTVMKRHLSLAEIKALFDQLKSEIPTGKIAHKLYALTAMIYLTGMRLGEAQRLTVSQIDLDTGFIDLTDMELKTPLSSSLVAMPDALIEVLRGWLPFCESPWAFPHAGKGRPGPWISGTTANRPLGRLQAAAARAGLTEVTFKAGRHTWSTMARMHVGYSDAIVQAQLRHTTPRTARENYTHYDASIQRETVRAFRYPGLTG